MLFSTLFAFPSETGNLTREKFMEKHNFIHRESFR